MRTFWPSGKVKSTKKTIKFLDSRGWTAVALHSTVNEAWGPEGEQFPYGPDVIGPASDLRWRTPLPIPDMSEICAHTAHSSSHRSVAPNGATLRWAGRHPPVCQTISPWQMATTYYMPHKPDIIGRRPVPPVRPKNA